MSARVVELSTGKKYRPRKARKATAQEERILERRVVDQKLDRAIEQYRAIIDFLSAPAYRERISFLGAEWIEARAEVGLGWCEGGLLFDR